ncbi:MAG: hypothetical protein RQ867_10300 [Mariprofundaceae bacterium]|nr:hypothetical protein [Mariprofundaceae bacterium]
MSLASEEPVTISRTDFDAMFGFARAVYRLKHNESYVARMEHLLPEAAKIRPDAPGILMGFDFHLTPDGPKLIEINNNAGGLYIGNGEWLPQPDISELENGFEQRILGMFPRAWKTIAIVDEDIEKQFMYHEMQAYAKLLEGDGREVFLVSPESVELKENGLYINTARIDAIYNRHTDFYLQSPAMHHIKRAYMAGQVQVNPHPRSYALLGDKSRMSDWWHEGVLEGAVSDEEIALIRAIVPETHLMSEYDPETVWRERSAWVFKPAARHGGKGVLIGKGISRKRFDEMEKSETVMQKFVPASQTEINGSSYKLDLRLYTQAERLIAVAGRVWQGQVTNFRSEGSGWVSLRIV